jgi:hypothetical protein
MSGPFRKSHNSLFPVLKSWWDGLLHIQRILAIYWLSDLYSIFYLHSNASLEKFLRILRIISKDSIASIVLLAALLASSPAQAHVVLLDPPPRTPDAGLTIDPCGGKSMGASMATYTAGTDIEITFNLTQQHRSTTNLYISYDNFATRTMLARKSTPDSGVYKMTVPLPAQPLGPAVFQLIHQSYYSCADITLEQGPEFVLNAGLNDAWYDPVTDGQGFFIIVFPELGVVVLAWFTYDTELPPDGAPVNLGDAGHRWLLAVGTFVDNVAMLDIEIASGGLFDTPTEIKRVTDGSIILSFEDCTKGTVEYDIPSINRQRIVPIQRVAKDNIALCLALSAD